MSFGPGRMRLGGSPGGGLGFGMAREG